MQKGRDFLDGQYPRSSLEGPQRAGLWFDEDRSTACRPARRHRRYLIAGGRGALISWPRGPHHRSKPHPADLADNKCA